MNQMLLSHDEIFLLCTSGVVNGWKHDAINSSSLDIHLGNKIRVERSPEGAGPIDYKKREPLNMEEHEIDEGGFILRPGEFILAQSSEEFNLPNSVSAEYKLKSSMARIGLEHMNAGWCDAGWYGSVLTLEFKNMTQWHSIILRPGDPIGQLVFFRHAPVGIKASYAARGRYNNDKNVSGIKK